jgi:hypothetical protein
MSVNGLLTKSHSDRIDVSGTYQNRLTTFVFCLAALAMAPMLFFILNGQPILAVGLLGGISFCILTLFQPLPAIFLLMLLSTNVFKFVDVAYLPSLSLGASGRLNAQDLLLLFLLGLAIIRLVQRKERPLFLIPLLLFGAMVCVAFGLGLLAGTTSISNGLNGVRSLSGLLFYVSLVGLVDTPAKLRWVLWMIYAHVIVTVGVQLAEASIGQRITTPTTVQNEYFTSTKLVDIAGYSAFYLWNRARGYLIVGLFLSLGSALWTKSVRYTAIAVVALLGFGLQLMREYYVYVAAGLLVMLLLPRRNRLQSILGLGTVTILLVAGVLILNSVALSSSYSYVDVWLARVQTLTAYEQVDTFQSRMNTLQDQMRLISGSPLFGYGPGSLSDLSALADCCFSDTGMPNTIVQYGFFGWGAILVIIAVFARRGYVLLRGLPNSQDQAYVAGLLGAWGAIVIGYFTFTDFFTFDEFVFSTGLAMALLDRIDAFAGAGRSTQTVAMTQADSPEARWPAPGLMSA